MRKKKSDPEPEVKNTEVHLDDYIFSNEEKDNLCAMLCEAKDELVAVINPFLNNVDHERYLRIHGLLSSLSSATEQLLGRMCLSNLQVSEKALRVMRAAIFLESMQYIFHRCYIASHKWNPEETIKAYDKRIKGYVQMILAGGLILEVNSIKEAVNKEAGI